MADDIIGKVPKVGKIYKTVKEAYNALKKGFTSQTKREPNPIEDQMIMEEAKTKIQARGENISILDDFREEGIGSLASGTTGMSKFVDESGEFTEKSKDIFKKGLEGLENRNKTKAVDRPFVTGEEMSAFTLEENARKLNKAKGMIDNLGAKTTKQKLFVADLVEDVGEGIFDNVDMGAVVRSNMFDDLIEQGVDDDLLTKIMYSGTKSDDFGITMAKIKGNAMDEGVDISETVDFYERTFNEVSRPKKADGGRIGYSIGSLPKGIQALVKGINKKFGKGSMKTADEMDQPEKTTQQLISEFESRNKPDAITMESREILDVPEVPKGFSLSKEKLMAKFPEIEESFADQMMDMDKDMQGRIIKMLENRRLDPEAYDRLLKQYGDTLEFQAEFDKVTRRKNNNQGGLNYLMGM